MGTKQLDLYIVAVIVIIPNSKGEILIGQRVAEGDWKNLYEVPQGKLDYTDKGTKEAAIREVLEETNLTVELEDSPIAIKHYPHSSTRNNYGLLALTYVATKAEGELQSLESENLRYMKPEDTLKLGLPIWIRDSIETYLAKDS